jgi:peptidoglycan/LPS O-acetylase OafA/YrhL
MTVRGRSRTASVDAGPATPAGRQNSFDLLRLIGALFVLVEHSWKLSGHPSPFSASTGSGFGGVGVDVFFLISGFLIPASWLADPSIFRFAARRALRIYPAFFVVIVLLTFVLGPWLTSWPLHSYLTSSRTYEFLVRNLLIFPMTWELPGVFEGVPYPGVVNGSLWTIRVEVLCYCGVVLLGLLGLLANRVALALLTSAALATMTWIDLTHYQGTLVPHLLDSSRAEPVVLFIIGMTARAWGPRAVPPWWAPIPLLALWAISFGTSVANILAILSVACVALVASFRLPARLQHPTGGHDLSYGTYIIAFPVQQLLVQAGVDRPVLLLVLSALVVLPLATLSWRLIERPALRIKPRRPPGPPRVKPSTPSAPEGEEIIREVR